jgi:DNA-binding transcriptional MerR regulator
MRIGELATAAGVSPRTVDYYTHLGLLTPAQRTAGGFRLYPPQAVDLIAVIRRLEDSGLRLEAIAGQLTSGRPDLAEVVSRLGQDLEALHGIAGSDQAGVAGAVVSALLARAHQLVITATELLGVFPEI